MFKKNLEGYCFELKPFNQHLAFEIEEYKGQIYKANKLTSLRKVLIVEKIENSVDADLIITFDEMIDIINNLKAMKQLGTKLNDK